MTIIFFSETDSSRELLLSLNLFTKIPTSERVKTLEAKIHCIRLNLKIFSNRFLKLVCD